MILITHDMGVIAEMADDVVVMYLGRVVEKGRWTRSSTPPSTPTRALLRSIPSSWPSPALRPPIGGSIPHPFNRPPGCPFHPRCPDFMPGLLRPRRAAPDAGGCRHEVSCFLYGRSAATTAAGMTGRPSSRSTSLRKWSSRSAAACCAGVVGHVRAVDGVSFDIRQGRDLSLVGESGCGKTTTSRCILRASSRPAGAIRFRTEDGRPSTWPTLSQPSCGRCGARCR